MLLLFSIKDQV